MAIDILESIYSVAHRGFSIKGLATPRTTWVRNVSDKKGGPDHRRGPWLSGVYDKYEIAAEGHNGDCLYVVRGNDGCFRYVGFSNRGLGQRWRTVPATEQHTGRQLPPQVFHSQCWKWLQKELERGLASSFEVRVVFEQQLATLLRGPLSKTALAADLAASPRKAASAEAWFRAKRANAAGGTSAFLPWNMA